MSVYTNLNTKDVSLLLSKYNIGTLRSFQGISDGITNTNYFLNTSKGKYIITIFEDITEIKVEKYLKLMNFFSNNNMCCPEIMFTKSGNILSKVKSKPCSIMEKLSGNTVSITNVSLCRSIGTIIGNFHNTGSKYGSKISNSRNIKWVERNIEKIKNHISKEQLDILNYSSKVFRRIFEMKLPNGMIHSDLFRDNVLARGDKVTGIIDYYYSFNGPFIYELAVIINDWCVNKDGSVNLMKYNSFLNSYNLERKLTAIEKKQMNNAMIAAGLRFYLSRLVDMIFPKVGEITHIKDPSAFETIVKKRINSA
jgi:homoserine kinase type II